MEESILEGAPDNDETWRSLPGASWYAALGIKPRTTQQTGSLGRNTSQPLVRPKSIWQRFCRWLTSALRGCIWAFLLGRA